MITPADMPRRRPRLERGRYAELVGRWEAEATRQEIQWKALEKKERETEEQ